MHFGVREYKKAMIREFFEKFDFDELGLDWLRSEVNLPERREYQHRYAVTDFVEDIRAMLNGGTYCERSVQMWWWTSWEQM